MIIYVWRRHICVCYQGQLPQLPSRQAFSKPTLAIGAGKVIVSSSKYKRVSFLLFSFVTFHLGRKCELPRKINLVLTLRLPSGKSETKCLTWELLVVFYHPKSRFFHLFLGVKISNRFAASPAKPGGKRGQRPFWYRFLSISSDFPKGSLILTSEGVESHCWTLNDLPFFL